MAAKVKAGAKKAAKRPKGRPNTYTLATAKQICEQIANSSTPLQMICDNNTLFPSRGTVYDWLLKHKEFSDMYARAKRLQADFMAEEIIRIADDGSGDEVPAPEIAEGATRLNPEYVQRSKLRIEARKWYASKLASDKYGDKLDVTTDGKEISSTVVISPFDKK